MCFFTKYTVFFRQICYKYEQNIFARNMLSVSDQTFTLSLASISLRKISLKMVRTRGWIKKSCVKNANGKLKHTSFSQLASNVIKLNPA